MLRYTISRLRLATASRAVTTEAPQRALSRRGRIPGAPRALYKAPTVALCLQPEIATRTRGLIGISPDA